MWRVEKNLRTNWCTLCVGDGRGFFSITSSVTAAAQASSLAKEITVLAIEVLFQDGWKPVFTGHKTGQAR